MAGLFLEHPMIYLRTGLESFSAGIDQGVSWRVRAAPVWSMLPWAYKRQLSTAAVTMEASLVPGLWGAAASRCHGTRSQDLGDRYLCSPGRA